MKPYDFDYRCATSISEVLELLAEHEGSAKILAGGQSLVTTLNMRLSAPELLIDINGLDEMHGIELRENSIRVGALTRHVEVQQSELLAEHVPLLKMAIDHVAHAAIRNRGTHGGSIAFADPAAEIPACTVALNAMLVISNQEGERQVPAREFFHDLYETDLQENEILVAVEYPLASAGNAAFFREFTRRKGDFATVGLAMSADIEAGQVRQLAPVFFGVANTPVLASKTAGMFIDRAVTTTVMEEAQSSLVDEIGVIGDMYASDEMKIQLAKHYFEEAIESLGVLK